MTHWFYLRCNGARWSWTFDVVRQLQVPTAFYQLSCGEGTAGGGDRSPLASAAPRAQRAARFYIELTLLIRFDLKREVNKPYVESASAPATSSRCREPVSVCLFYGTRLTTVKMVEVKITDDIKIGGGNPCFIIAEIGQNHQGDIEIAKKLIKAAKVSSFPCSFHIFCVEQEAKQRKHFVFCRRQCNNLFLFLGSVVYMLFKIRNKHSY